MDVELTDQERKFLTLGPDFPLMENLEEKQIERDILTALTKIRWTRTGKESKEVVRFETLKEVQEEDDMKELVQEINGL